MTPENACSTRKLKKQVKSGIQAQFSSLITRLRDVIYDVTGLSGMSNEVREECLECYMTSQECLECFITP